MANSKFEERLINNLNINDENSKVIYYKSKLNKHSQKSNVFTQ